MSSGSCFARVLLSACLLLLAWPVGAQTLDSAGPDQAVAVGYDVGPNYHSTTADFFGDGVFISRYQDPRVRATVIEQLQTIADAGSSIVKTALWQVGTPFASWQVSFPLTDQDLSSIQMYAQDVAMTRRPDGGYLGLQLSMQWVGCADYTHGSADAIVGDCEYSWTEFTADARTSIAALIQRVADVRDPDGRRVVRKLYLESEVMIGAKPNQDRFLLDIYPYFMDETTRAGLDGSIYFMIVPSEADILDDSFIDVEYPVLSGHKSLFWLYRSVAFLVSHGLPVPDRLDFSFYPDQHAAPYSQLVDRVFDDFQTVFPGHRAAVVETYYFQDSGRRAELGQAFAAAYLARGLPEQVSFWTTPYGGLTPDVGPAFDIAAFALPRPDPESLQGSIDASPNLCDLEFVSLCSTTISWLAAVQSETARVFVRLGDGPPRLFACGNAGEQQAPWIRRGVQYTFTLDAASSCDSPPQLSPLASVTVTGQR
jgi:hypothetical protein